MYFVPTPTNLTIEWDKAIWATPLVPLTARNSLPIVVANWKDFHSHPVRTFFQHIQTCNASSTKVALNVITVWDTRRITCHLTLPTSICQKTRIRPQALD